MKALMIFEEFNKIAAMLFGICFMYQMVYMVIGLLAPKEEPEETREKKRYAFMICARNEENVIGELAKSLRAQDYPKELYDIYVLADNCIDATARKAREAGAIVYERFNPEKIGKGYALNELYSDILRDEGTERYDAYIVFDADNIADPHFLSAMNRSFASGKYDAITGYRASKNYGENWITAGYSLWFLREARFTNDPRMRIGSTCMVSGTGFLVSAKLMKENGGWPYHLLTEDIEFSVNCALHGKRIGYCDDAVFYDEQPSSFAVSFRQRLRWTKGFFQITAKYGKNLIRKILQGRENAFDCYDVLMTVAPASILTAGLLIYNLVILGASFFMNSYMAGLFQAAAIRYLLTAVWGFFSHFFLMGALTMIKDWKRIPATPYEKIANLIVFPLFMFTYVPVTIAAVFAKPEWKPIKHGAISRIK